ncbi:DegQ family serine endoprotease [uncultured Piscinibacter sp.]|uniref:DegQ family serine endoprotease n=1 Tax=uncultured Piscinibacter sp. TaxID=1131835 RepID=UPI0026149BC5|nr:DegQ family serine endoprotease [uncultured Piscinibacter sp.]
MHSTVTAAARRSFVVALAGLVLATGTIVSSPAMAQALPEFADLAERIGPAVVNIRTTERRAARPDGMPEMDEDMLEFFRRFGLPIPNQPPRGQRPQPDAEPQQRGVGSGFILSADGYVMTNAHVIDGADEVFVTLTDKREFKARVIGADRRSDVALVKIDANGLPSVRIGDVNRLRVGEWVIAIGSPFGLENTVTAGIVSAKARDTGEFLPLIQTDVAINPGNSGGPLINMRGEVVGINSQIYSRSGGYMGISFAIPIDEATRVADQLKTTGRVSRGRIGVSIDQVTKDVAESIGLGKPTGALVRSVEAGGPAEKAGIEAGDIITRFDGRVVEKSGDLPRIVGGVKPGSKTTLQVFRRGAYKDLSVVVAEVEPDRVRRSAETETKPQVVAGTLGIGVADLNESQKRELKLKNGVRVELVEGAAARAGVREGDVILSIDNTEVTSAKQFEAVVAKLDKKRAVTLLVRRGDTVNFLIIRPVSR